MTHIPGRSEQCLESVCGIGQTDISTIALSRTTVDQGPLSTDTRLKSTDRHNDIVEGRRTRRVLRCRDHMGQHVPPVTRPFATRVEPPSCVGALQAA